MSFGTDRVVSQFAAFDQDGAQYMVKQYVTVHEWRQGADNPVEWAEPSRFRLADGTAVERGARDRYWFRDSRGRYVDLTLKDPRGT